MKIDAHYFALLAFARGVGFNKEAAYQIAYASQFVDDAKINQITLDEITPQAVLRELIPENFLLNMATCHSYFKINTFNYEAMLNNTTAFHFVPGCEGTSFSKKMRCKEESPIIMDILNEVKTVSSKQDHHPIELGVVLHAYADTFAHQGFSGIVSKVNDIRDQCPLDDVYDNQINEIKLFVLKQLPEEHSDNIPAYGHGQAYHYPDYPYLHWEYAYDRTDNFSLGYKKVKVANPDRYIRAFQNIKTHLQEYLKNHPEYRDDNVEFNNYELFFANLISQTRTDKRISNWQQIFIDQKLLQQHDKGFYYDENEWLREAFLDFKPHRYQSRTVREAVVADDFFASNWYKFYQAVSWYKELFYESANKYELFKR